MPSSSRSSSRSRERHRTSRSRSPATGRTADGSFVPKYEELKNVTFAGYVSPSRLVALYHTADVLFAQLQRSELHRITAAPSKLQEYMAAGRFIVYAGEGSAAELVERSGAGVVVPPGDGQAVVAALASSTPEERRAHGEAARAYAERLPTRVEEMRRLARLVVSLA